MALLRSAGYALALAALLACTQALAAKLDYAIDLGIEHNDNINLSATDPVTENVLRPSLGFSFDEAGSTVQARVDGVVEYHDYLNGTYANEFRSQLGGHVNWVMLPERLAFVVDDFLGVLPVDTLAANTPSNLQQTNVFVAGPNLAFRLGASTRGLAELRYANSYAEVTKEFDSQRFSSALRVIRDLDPTSQLSGNLQAEHIETTHADSGPSYDRYSLYGRYARKLRLFDFGVDLGYTWLSSSGSGRDHNHPLLRANAAWRPSERSTFSATLADQYIDAASSMVDTIPTLITLTPATPLTTSVSTGSAIVTSAPYQERSVYGTYAYHGDHLTFGISPYYAKLNYLDANLYLLAFNSNQINRGAVVDGGWLLRPELTIGLAANIGATHYLDIDRTDRNRTYVAYLRQQLARHWGWRAELTHYRRSSTAAGQNSDQNIIFVALVYTR
jgi:hypothetical protein